MSRSTTTDTIKYTLEQESNSEALLKAIREGKNTLACQLISRGDIPLDRVGQPLWLTNKGYNTVCINETALAAAIRYNQPSLITALLAAGASLDGESQIEIYVNDLLSSYRLNKQLMPIEIAEELCFSEWMKSARPTPGKTLAASDKSSLFEALCSRPLSNTEKQLDKARYGEVLVSLSDKAPELAIKLIQAGAPLRHRIDGNSALHIAAHYDQTELIKHLLLAGADSTKTNLAGKTALQLAMDARNTKSAALLADLSPLHVAALTGDNPRIQTLIEKKSLISYRDSKGNTPIINAAIAKRWESVQCFAKLQKAPAATKSDVDPAGYGYALNLAAAANQTATVIALLNAGTNPDYRPTPTTKSALEYAVDHNNIDLLAALLDAGANEEALNNNYEDLVDYAQNQARIECIAEINDTAKKTARTVAKTKINPGYAPATTSLSAKVLELVDAEILKSIASTHDSMATKLRFVRQLQTNTTTPNISLNAETTTDLIKKYSAQGVRKRHIQERLTRLLSTNEAKTILDANDHFLLDLDSYKAKLTTLLEALKTIELGTQTNLNSVKTPIALWIQTQLSQLAAIDNLDELDSLYLNSLKLNELIVQIKYSAIIPGIRIPIFNLDEDNLLTQLADIPNQILDYSEASLTTKGKLDQLTGTIEKWTTKVRAESCIPERVSLVIVNFRTQLNTQLKRITKQTNECTNETELSLLGKELNFYIKLLNEIIMITDLYGNKTKPNAAQSAVIEQTIELYLKMLDLAQRVSLDWTESENQLETCLRTAHSSVKSNSFFKQANPLADCLQKMLKGFSEYSTLMLPAEDELSKPSKAQPQTEATSSYPIAPDTTSTDDPSSACGAGDRQTIIAATAPPAEDTNPVAFGAGV